MKKLNAFVSLGLIFGVALFSISLTGSPSGRSFNFLRSSAASKVAEKVVVEKPTAPTASAAAPVVEMLPPGDEVTLTTEFLITSGTDDAEMNVLTGEMDLGSSDIELTRDGSTEQGIGLRFSNITIPAGATITEAYIQVTVDEVNTDGVVNVLILLEDAVNAATYSSAIGNLSSRSSYVGDVPTIWQPGSFAAVNDAGLDQRTPDLSHFLTYLINEPGWAAGNPVSFLMVDPFVLDVPGFTGNGAFKRVFKTYNNNPTFAAKLVVTYTAADAYANGNFPVEAGSSWLYNDLGVDLTAEAWTTLGYNDEEWYWGDAKLGYGDGDEVTVLDFGPDAANKYPTYYLRHKFNVEDAGTFESLVFNVRRDDGAVVYVNGTEAFRMNMPEGEIGFNTLASSAVAGAAETNFFQIITENLLVTGENIIAVELHQSAVSSSDLGFDMSVTGDLLPLEAATYPLAQNSQWNYLDNGADLFGTNWATTAFDDSDWVYGQGPLGYGDPMNTVVSFGPDANNKYVTTYFRRGLMVNLAELGEQVVFGLRRDDGAVVYVNGVEAFRDNMPEGQITYLSEAPATIAGSAETTYFQFLVSTDMFVDGLNQIAVTIHNRDVFSSDLGFDMFIEDAPVINPPFECAGEHISCFTSIVPTSETPTMLIATEHNFQQILKQGDAYITGEGSLPGNHDFTGYVPIAGSSELGYLSVNHETSPGGVTIGNIHFDPTTKLWVLDNSRAVDFFNSDLVTTNRNCSGGITPWGTVITAEENTGGADDNGDGYQDRGWLVEIDPATAAVVDYENDGVQDKLWAMGRMSHENVVVSNDMITAYYGEDGGTQCVYKFIADAPGNLSTGTVYVLSLDLPLVNDDPSGTTATWIEVPNTTQEERNNIRFTAAALGGTNFNGVEDVEINPITGKIYFTSKGKDRVYRFTDNGTTISNFETFVGGTSYAINTAEGVFIEPWGDGNDNLTFDDLGNLWVLQDGGRNYIWVVRTTHTQASPQVEIFSSSPVGSEPTGLTFSPDYRFGFYSIQHPASSNQPQVDATGNEVVFDASAVVIFALRGELGTSNVVEECTGDYSYFLADVDADSISTIYGVELDMAASTAALTPLKTVDYEVHVAYNNTDNLLYMVRSQGGSYRTLDVSVADGELGAVIELSDPLTKVTAAVFNVDGKLLIGDTDSGIITSVDAATGERFPFGMANVSGGDLSFGLDGQLYLASRIGGGILYTVNVVLGENEMIGTLPGTVTGMATMPNGNLLISAKDASQLVVRATDGSNPGQVFNLTLNGEPFTTFNGDFGAGCVSVEDGNGEGDGLTGNNFSSVGVDEMVTSNTLYALPNPTEGELQIIFSTANTDQTLLEVYDLNGRLVETLFNGVSKQDIKYRFDFNGSALPNGIYIYRLVTTNQTTTEKFVIAR